MRAWLEHYVLSPGVIFEVAGDPATAGPENEYPDGRKWDGANMEIESVTVVAVTED